ncbi:MAG: SDR family NAD(P)-dependent oxidoreductase [Clostridia bacterium]|nr:SDR family NAD(P)-dependent oxidoreductase [Clostridia bacterium]
MIKCWFDYKTVIVTGASAGMGKGIVEKLIKEHNCTVIGIARNAERLENVKEELGDKGYKFSYRTFDVSVESNWIDFAQYLKKEGIQPDILINNAGILPRFDKFGHYTIGDIERGMNINFYSAIYSMHYLLPLILESASPTIFNIASSAALCALAGTSVYSASKAALKSMTEAVREEYRGRCYVGLFCPGFTKTSIFREQDVSKGKKALDMVSTDCDYMVEKIIEALWKKKSESVVGIDAKFMGEGGKVAGVLTSWFCSKVLKMSRLPMFEQVFVDDGE